MLSTRALFTGSFWDGIPAGPYHPSHGAAPILTQLHCHTTQSDGDYTPAQVVAYYEAAGYGCLQITDHDLVTVQPAGIAVALSGNELSPAAHHIISIGNGYTRGVETDAQALIDGIKAAGGEAVIAHPHYTAGMSEAEMAALTGWMGVEVHNGRVETGADSDPVAYPGFALSRWDALLASRQDIWGLAVDDLHFIDAFNTYDVSRTWVFARSPSPETVMAALRRGDFVADVSNHGLEPGYPMRTASGVSLSCSGASRIEAWGSSGLLDAADADTLAYPFVGTEGYVRLVAVGGYSEGFGSLSDRWQAYDGTWAATGGVLALSSATADPRRIILRRHRAGDFTASVRVRLGAGVLSGLALMFNVLDDERYYILRLGESGVEGWDGVLGVDYTTTDGFSDPPLDSHSFSATEGTWYTVSMAYTASTGRIRAKVWESEEPDWQIDVTDTTWTHGAFGFRANFAAQFDDLTIDGFRTYYQPITV